MYLSQLARGLSSPSDGFLTANAQARSTRRDTELVQIQSARCLEGVELWTIQRSPRLWSFWFDAYLFAVADPACLREARPQYRYLQWWLDVHGADISLWEPGETLVQTKNGGNFSFLAIRLSPEFVRQQLVDEEATSEAFHFALPGVSGGALCHGLVGLHNLLTNNDADQLESEGALRELFLPIFEAACEGKLFKRASGCARAVRHVQELIMDDCGTKLSLDELAQSAGVSKYHLERSFKESVGMPIHRFRQYVRVTRGLDLLRKGMSPSEVAGEVGLCDQAHLTRVFRSTIGTTPGEFRQSLARIARQLA